jgi:hypothetical protein
MKQLRQRKLDDIVGELEDTKEDDEYFKAQYFDTFTTQLPFIQDELNDKYLCIAKPPLHQQQHKRYKFLKNKKPYQRHLKNVAYQNQDIRMNISRETLLVN